MSSSIANFGLSSYVTGGKPLEGVKKIDGELGRIITQLGGKKHYIENPEQALDLFYKLSHELSFRDDESFVYGILYIIGEYTRNSGDYNINGADNKGLSPQGVNQVRNRQGFISGQVYEILRNPQSNPINPMGNISQIDFTGLSQNITNFLVSNANREERTKIQSMRDLLRENLDIEATDWPSILTAIERKFHKTTEKQQAA